MEESINKWDFEHYLLLLKEELKRKKEQDKKLEIGLYEKQIERIKYIEKLMFGFEED